MKVEHYHQLPFLGYKSGFIAVWNVQEMLEGIGSGSRGKVKNIWFKSGEKIASEEKFILLVVDTMFFIFFILPRPFDFPLRSDVPAVA